MSIEKGTSKIKIVKDGPYLVLGNIPMTRYTIVANKEGRSVKWEKGNGHSKNKPFCDSRHISIGFLANKKINEEEKIK